MIGKYGVENRLNGKIHPTITRHYNLKYRWKMSWPEYEELLSKQNGVCAICSSLPSKHRRLAIDHNHATGCVRALLRQACNSRIGVLERDDLQKYFDYLKVHRSIQEIT